MNDALNEAMAFDSTLRRLSDEEFVRLSAIVAVFPFPHRTLQQMKDDASRGTPNLAKQHHRDLKRLLKYNQELRELPAAAPIPASENVPVVTPKTPEEARIAGYIGLAEILRAFPQEFSDFNQIGRFLQTHPGIRTAKFSKNRKMVCVIDLVNALANKNQDVDQALEELSDADGKTAKKEDRK